VLAAFIAFGFALIVFGLSGEAQTGWLRVLGFIVASLITISGAISGWRHFQK
jgi:hypothetical protein